MLKQLDFEPTRIQMKLAEAITYNSGTLILHVFSGKFSKSGFYLQALIDDRSHPSLISSKVESKELHIPVASEMFVRDLKHSRLIFRLGKKKEVLDPKDVLFERSFPTMDILQKSYNRPSRVTFDTLGSAVVQMEFIPSSVQLPDEHTVKDVGILQLDIIGAEDLKSVDSNGKSDPFCVISLNGIVVHKTEKKRKTLSPTWNETTEFPMFSRSRDVLVVHVFDWDLTHDDELLGVARIDLSTIEPNRPIEFLVNLDTQGSVKLRGTFKPQFVRPKLTKSGSALNVMEISGAGIKMVGGVVGGGAAAVGNLGGAVVGGGLNLGGAVVGGGYNLVSDNVSSGAGFLKDKFGRLGGSKSRKKANKRFENDSDANNDSFISRQSTRDESFIEAEQRLRSDQSKYSAPSPEKQKQQEIPTSSGEAVPNVNSDFLPPPQNPLHALGHRRVSSQSTLASSFILNSTFAPGGNPGRIVIESIQGVEAGALRIKATLRTSSRTKDIYKTRALKPNSSGAYVFGELFGFRAPQDAVVELQVVESHSFGRRQSVGDVRLAMSDYTPVEKTYTLPLGDGELKLKIMYG